MPDPQTDAQLAEDDAGILAAAVALCWHARPVMAFGPGLGQISCRTAQEWWNVQPEMERRLHIGRARSRADGAEHRAGRGTGRRVGGAGQAGTARAAAPGPARPGRGRASDR